MCDGAVLDLCPQALGDPGCTLQVGPGQQHGKLLTADARHHVSGTDQARLQGMCDGLQAFIPCDMPQTIVVCLEKIDIADQQRQRHLFSACPPHLEGLQLIEMPAIRQPRQGIGARKVLKALVGRFQLGGSLLHQHRQMVSVGSKLLFVSLLLFQVGRQTVLQLVDPFHQVAQFILCVLHPLQAEQAMQIAWPHTRQMQGDALHMHGHHAIEDPHDQGGQQHGLQQLHQHNGRQGAPKPLPQHTFITRQLQLAHHLAPSGEWLIGEFHSARRRPTRPRPSRARLLNDLGGLVGQRHLDGHPPHRWHADRTLHMRLQGVAVQLPDRLGQGGRRGLLDLHQLGLHALAPLGPGQPCEHRDAQHNEEPTEHHGRPCQPHTQ